MSGMDQAAREKLKARLALQDLSAVVLKMVFEGIDQILPGPASC